MGLEVSAHAGVDIARFDALMTHNSLSELNGRDDERDNARCPSAERRKDNGNTEKDMYGQKT